MRRPGPGAISTRLWFGGVIAVSATLVVITFASYALVDHRPLKLFLFWLGLGGEDNIGAWWSGMLLALAGFLAFDGFYDPKRPLAECRGWLALGFALLLLSFDEIASLHEYLSALGLQYLAVLGVVGLSVASYAMFQLYRARASTHALAMLLLAFGLLATVPVHELLQHRLQWNSPVVYGLRAVLEEGTEILATLIFISVARATSASLLRSSQDFLVALVRNRRLVTLTALLLWPVLTAATFKLPEPGGPADWLASTLFLGCALLAVRAGVLRRGGLDWRALSVIVFYIAASATATAVKFPWHPLVLGTRVSLRGIAFAVLLLTAIAVLRPNGRPLKPSHVMLAAAAIGAGAVAWPSSQILWCGLPPLLALWIYSTESKLAAESGAVSVGVDRLKVRIDLERVPAGSLSSTRNSWL